MADEMAKRGLRKLKLSNGIIDARLKGLLCPRCHDKLTLFLLCPSCGIRYKFPRKVKGKHARRLAFFVHTIGEALEVEHEIAVNERELADKHSVQSEKRLELIGAAFLEWQGIKKQYNSLLEQDEHINVWRIRQLNRELEDRAHAENSYLQVIGMAFLEWRTTHRQLVSERTLYRLNIHHTAESNHVLRLELIGACFLEWKNARVQCESLFRQDAATIRMLNSELASRIFAANHYLQIVGACFLEWRAAKHAFVGVERMHVVSHSSIEDFDLWVEEHSAEVRAMRDKLRQLESNNVAMWKLLNELVETPNANLLDFVTNMRALLDGVDIAAFNRD